VYGPPLQIVGEIHEIAGQVAQLARRIPEVVFGRARLQIRAGRLVRSRLPSTRVLIARTAAEALQ
jgi:hypothetical protein